MDNTLEIQKTKKEDKINLLDFLIILLKHKEIITIITLLSVLITLIISLIMTPIYRAETKILPSQQNSSDMAAQTLNQLSGLAGLVVGGLEVKGRSSLYVEVLKSRSVLDPIIKRFNLMELYRVETLEDARDKFLKAFEAEADKKTEIITIEVEDIDPGKAADIANALVEELKRVNNDLTVTEASQRKVFFEEQLKEAKDALISSEEAMKGFQEETGAIKIDEQARAILQAIANLKAEIASKEVNLRVMSTYATPRNPDRQKVEEELKGMREQLKRLEEKDRSPNSGATFIPTRKIPEIGTEYIRREREFKFRDALYEFLSKQYEAARLDEARDAVIIQVIDRAVPPEKRARPKRILMVIVAAVGGFFFSIYLAFFIEFREKISNDPENAERLKTIKKYAFLKLRKGERG